MRIQPLPFMFSKGPTIPCPILTSHTQEQCLPVGACKIRLGRQFAITTGALFRISDFEPRPGNYLPHSRQGNCPSMPRGEALCSPVTLCFGAFHPQLMACRLL